MKRKITGFDIFLSMLFTIISISFLYPFWQLVVKSFSTNQQIIKDELFIWPWEWSLKSYETIFKSNSVLLAYRNTIKRTVIGTILSVLVTFAGAYSLSKPTLPFIKVLMALITFTMFFGGGLIPSYLVISALGLKGSFWVLILPCLASAWNVILARNFLYMMSRELEESAYVDGAGVFKTLSRIVIPLSMPILAVLVLYNAIFHWNAWFDAYIYLKGEANITLQLLLRRILFEVELQNSEYFDTLTAKTMPPSATITAATIVITIGPIVAVYPFVQKYFVKGVMVGAVKG